MFTTLMLAALSSPCVAVTPEDEAAKAAVAVEIAKLQLRSSSPPIVPALKRTICGCGITRNCTCWSTECACGACGLGGSTKQAPKSLSDSIPTTPARSATTPHPKEPAPGSSADTLPEGTYTLVPSAAILGGTSGCANGQCPSSTTRRRGLFK